MVLGVDIGKKYGLCKLREGEMPEVDLMDGKFMYEYLRGIDAVYEPVLVVYEKINSNPRFGVKQCFSFGYELGWFEALLKNITVTRVEVVAPLKWKNRLHIHSKRESIELVTARWNEQIIIPAGGRTPNHNMADAVCLAHYGSLTWEVFL